MYESIQGILKDKSPLKAVVEAGGIGYRLFIPLSTYTRLPPKGALVSFFLVLIVREDAHLLYGFDRQEERDTFEMILSVSGIGPKTALAIVGHMDVPSLQRAIKEADIRVLSSLPGIGKKTAERLVIEMRDKWKKKGESLSSLLSQEPSLEGDAVGALVQLGYSLASAQKAVSSVVLKGEEEQDLGSIITKALQRI